MRNLISISTVLCICLINQPANTQKKKNKNTKPPEIESSDKAAIILGGKKITIGDAIRLVLKKNRDALIETYEIAMSNSIYQVYLKKYSPFLDLNGGARYKKNPLEMGSLVGDDEKKYDMSAAISKNFSTGTTMSLGYRHEYVKTTPRPFILPGSSASLSFTEPEFNRPLMFVSIQQELLKNIFGYLDRREIKIRKNRWIMKREALIFQLSRLVSEVIVDYWVMQINISNVRNAGLQLKETRKVRNITAANVKFGLAERYNINYYNTLVAAAEGRLVNAKQGYRDSLRKFMNEIDYDDKSEIEGNPVFINKLPIIDYETALKAAYSKRSDYRNALTVMKNARLELEKYENEGLPSITAELNIQSIAQGKSRSDSFSDMSSGKYPSWEGRLKFTYFLDNREQKTNLRNSRFRLKQAKIQVERYKRLIRDDIQSRIERIKTNYKLYQKAVEVKKQSRLYYFKLLNNMRKGKVNAAEVKNGLDSITDSSQKELEALVQYNIALLQFDISKNELFESYNININRYLPE